MKTSASLLLSLVLSGVVAHARSMTSFLQNDRLKTITLPDRLIMGSDRSRFVSGFWVSESKDLQKKLVFPQQVKIECHNYASKECVEIIVTIAPVKGMVSIQDIDTETYDVNTWDSRGLVASYGGDESSRCQRHVLTMEFASGAVSVSDIPTRVKGCEAFSETDSYRLVRGNYYVDTSPENDMDKPYKPDEPKK